MNAIEMFANGPSGGEVRPLAVVEAALPTSCFWAALAGGAFGVLAQAAVNRYVAAHYGSHLTAESPVASSAVSVALSGDQLLALASGHTA
ncbi:hypothetical protein [Kutzneria buriramensis]|uniref:Uncharacterized protein n=1 Tax=Kutzneria buriramensis TaxID=1045776 RepID=A0A3E0GUK7_9PSEU|nr:hypothetical protein [Kutzneria buriramensis]REH28571.1 hypothetical protein BCF44_12613 [Kutzneria buriramensis]